MLVHVEGGREEAISGGNELEKEYLIAPDEALFTSWVNWRF